MKFEQKLNNFLTVILVICALIVTILVVRRELFLRQNNLSYQIVKISNWEILLSGGQIVGNRSAAVYIVEFFDYECPYCKEMEMVLKKLINKYKGKVSLIRYNFPLPGHKYSYDAAVASLCASNQGKYESFHEILIREKTFDGRWDSLAVLAEIQDILSFRKCLLDKDARNRIQNEINIAKRFNIQSVPTIVINGYMIQGMISEEQLDKLIQKLMK